MAGKALSGQIPANQGHERKGEVGGNGEGAREHRLRGLGGTGMTCGGGALVKQGGDGRAWKLCWGEGKVGGCLIWAGLEWRAVFRGELKTRR